MITRDSRPHVSDDRRSPEGEERESESDDAEHAAGHGRRRGRELGRARAAHLGVELVADVDQGGGQMTSERSKESSIYDGYVRGCEVQFGKDNTKI